MDVRNSSLLCISGTASVGPAGESLHPGDFAAQAERMLRNVTALLAAAGATWQDVFKTTIYLKDMTFYGELAEIRARFFAGQGITLFPASTCVQAALCRPELLCEMEVLATVRGA